MNAVATCTDALIASASIAVATRTSRHAAGVPGTKIGRRKVGTRALTFVLDPPSHAQLWQTVKASETVVDIAVEARRLLPREILRSVGSWEASALAFAPGDGDIRFAARARDEAPRVLDERGCAAVLHREAERGAALLEELVARAGSAIASDTAGLRGAFVRLCASIERRGLPIDRGGLAQVLGRAREILVAAGNEYEVGELLGCDARTDPHSVRELIRRLPVPKRLTASGEICVDRAALEFAARVDPSLDALLRFKEIEGVFRSFRITVGDDGRTRPRLHPFGATTGRCAPRKSVLSLPTFFWAFLRPEAGRALVYVDFASQEVGIAAALSGDVALQAAYACGDPYASFALDIGALASFDSPRSVAKTSMLGLQYGMGATTLAERLGCTRGQAGALVAAHRSKFAGYWRWIGSVVAAAKASGLVETGLGWRRVLVPWPGAPSVQNFPLQSTAAEMLMVAALLVDSFGEIVALNHDAIMLEVDEDQSAAIAESVAWAMQTAAREVLGGFELRTESSIATHSRRFPRSRSRDDRVWRFYRALSTDGLVKEGADEPT